MFIFICLCLCYTCSCFSRFTSTASEQRTSSGDPAPSFKPPWRNWLARSAVNRKVGGSSPPGGATSNIFCSVSILSEIGTKGTKDVLQLHRPGIEPGPPAWQASILPLNQRCCFQCRSASLTNPCSSLAECEVRWHWGQKSWCLSNVQSLWKPTPLGQLKCNITSWRRRVSIPVPLAC